MSLPSLKSLVRPMLSRRIRPHRIVGGPLRGARIVTSWHDYPAGILGRTERPLVAWFKGHVRSGTTWLDIGAHYGYTAIALSRLVGPVGRVFTFEPLVATAGCVTQTRVLNGLDQLTVIPQGLGCPQSLEIRRLPTVRGMADSTLMTVGARGWETIQIARFDWLWPLINGGNDRIDGIKIDVQGMELTVLEGMRQALRQHLPKLVLELHRGVSREAILDLLAETGYSTRPYAIEANDGDEPERLRDDRSYAFRAAMTTPRHRAAG